MGIAHRWGRHSQESEGKEEARGVIPCNVFLFQGTELKYGQIRRECDRVFTAPPENLNTAALQDLTMSHVCYEGACASRRKCFTTIRGLRTHYEKAHQNTPDEETSLGSSRSLKRKRDAEDEEDRQQRQRQDLEVQMAIEAANREPELRPVSLIYGLQGRKLTHFIQVPLLERVIDAGLQRSTRTKRLPVRFRDSLPAPAPRAAAQSARLQKETEALTQQTSLDPSPPLNGGLNDSTDSTNHPPAVTTTNPNSFGVFWEYSAVSSHNPRNPDAFVDAQPTLPTSQSIGSGLMAIPPSDSRDNPLTNSTNTSTDLMLSWMATSSGNTPAGVNNLVHGVIMHPDFQPSDLKDFNAVTAIRRFERERFGAGLAVGDGWKEGRVSIRVPCTGVAQKECDAPEFVVAGILYRDVVEVVTAELEDPDAFNDIHVTSYKEMWSPGPGEDPVRVYSEIYNSDAMLEADRRMRDDLNTAAAHGPDDDLETFVVSALLYSDSTHLASFGTASLWPIYLFLGNVSKYIHSKPTSFSAHHIAYIPTVHIHSFIVILSRLTYISAPRHHQGVLSGTLQEGTQRGDAYLFGTRANSRGPAPDLGRLICGRLQEPSKGQMRGQNFASLAS